MRKIKILLFYYLVLYFVYVVMCDVPVSVPLWKWYFPIKLILLMLAYVWMNIHVEFKKMLEQKYIISKNQLELMKRRFIFSNTIRFILFTILGVFVFPWIVSVIKLKYKVDLFFILLNWDFISASYLMVTSWLDFKCKKWWGLEC